MIVRHPFERLISAYRDKIVYRTWRNWKENILERTKGKPDPARIEPMIPTFKEFVTFHLSNGTHNKQSQDFDMHVRPFWHDCDPCNLPYSLIAKVETLDEDTK